VHRDFRKPLIVVSPKNLLRHKSCVSPLDEMGTGTRFHRIYRYTPLQHTHIQSQAHNAKGIEDKVPLPCGTEYRPLMIVPSSCVSP
jgi:2-oxoglutarate dehydrogenase complex dehydrogenase (E1) component-like enzyme